MGSEAVTDGILAEIPSDAAILIAGPPMTGKYSLFLRLLFLHADTVLLVSTKHGFARVYDDLEAVVGEFDPDRVGIVDCVGYHATVDLDEPAGPVQFADSPENLTRIGVKFTELFDRFHGDPETGRLGVGLHSVSQLLMHSEVRQVYQFLQVLIGQIRTTGCLVVAVVDGSTTEDETLRTLQQHFDGLVETRESDDGIRQFRVRGLTPSSSPWTEF